LLFYSVNGNANSMVFAVKMQIILIIYYIY
jgi:hypothetical protein